MAKRRLSEKDIDQLLSHYRSERRRLSFQLETIRTAIVNLKKTKNALPKPPAARVAAGGTVKRGPGRPRKGEAVAKKATKAKRGPGRPPKRIRKERELNKWDLMVLNAIKSTGRLL